MSAGTLTSPAALDERPGTGDRRPSLLRLTGVELRKLADTRAGLWLLIVIALTAVAIVTVQLFVAPAEEQTFRPFFESTLLPVGVLLPVLGILSVTSEWSQRTALTTFALVPARHRVVLAKLAAVVVAALLSVVASIAVAAAGTVVADLTGGAGTWSVPGALLWHAAVLQVANVLIGIAFGLLLGSTPLAIVLYFVLPTVWSVLGEMVAALRKPAEWLDTAVTMTPLFSAEVTGGQWARLGTSLLLWLVAPLVAGLVRTMRREVS
ncbi:ABC transporter permease [Micromonospora sagamiensis]|uniref:ABC-2 family transporter n=1 Tax=Micromonospora sagamiensis TaxID=47875 RepID=A0A562WL77_9ACTN|nr:ABC transporter permease [Micromonospora sagamiensis]TWJ31040.1 hypothetical protein JD81_04592 [Micromonospora sagamiensis]BCL15918.1 hypothetical protein GCM10017556_36570 [Micromonospora sagamiensis]